jgi:hypothetical protein
MVFNSAINGGLQLYSQIYNITISKRIIFKCISWLINGSSFSVDGPDILEEEVKPF